MFLRFTCSATLSLYSQLATCIFLKNCAFPLLESGAVAHSRWSTFLARHEWYREPHVHVANQILHHFAFQFLVFRFFSLDFAGQLWHSPLPCRRRSSTGLPSGRGLHEDVFQRATKQEERSCSLRSLGRTERLRPFLPTTPRQDLTGSAPLQTTIVHTMSRCSSYTRCTDQRLRVRVSAGSCMRTSDSGCVARFCDVEGTRPDAQCPRKPPSLLLVLLEEIFSEDTRDVHFCIIQGSSPSSTTRTPQLVCWAADQLGFSSSPHCLGKLLLSLCDPST